MGKIVTTSRGPSSQFSEVIGRAEEIARFMGSPVAGPEHFLLGMLHARSWPVRVLAERGMLSASSAEAAVMSVMNGPGYRPPELLAPAPALPIARENVRLLAGPIAWELGDSEVGELHAFLGIIRKRDTVPARALAGLADLDAVEAALLAARSAPPEPPPPSAVILPADQDFDDDLQEALIPALRGTGICVGVTADERVWIEIIGRDTRSALNAALTRLGRLAAGPGG